MSRESLKFGDIKNEKHKFLYFKNPFDWINVYLDYLPRFLFGQAFDFKNKKQKYKLLKF